MAAEIPGSIDLEARRAELEAVLRSSSFTRAPALAHLLSYLCEKLFCGESYRIKEYSVAVDVFNRGSSFDQDSDSIVRVEANRLRKRLAEYYAGEGASNRLQITIPLGQYVPDFKAAPPRLTESALTGEVPSVAGVTAIEIAQPERGKHWFHSHGRLVWEVVAAVVLLLAGLGYTRHYIQQQKQTPAAGSSSRNFDQPDEPEVGPPAGEEVRILAGEGRSFVDHAGKLWSADTWFSGGTAVKSSVQHIWRTQNPDFYRTSRQGQFSYKIPLKKGIYELRLHFAETVYCPEENGPGGEGSRIMAVRANGKTILNNFDIVADAGGGCTADVKVFPGMSPAADGYLYLDFSGEDGRQAILSAIEILPGVRGHIRPVRILARQTPYYSNDSHWWSPDNYYEGGQMASYTTAVTGTDDPELYESERWGNFSYSIPVSPGRYSVVLHFAARHGNWNQALFPAGEHGSPVAHIFNVFCNGRVLLQDFNLGWEARQTDVVIRRFTSLEPNAQGKLLLSFVPVEGYATVTGIEVLPQ